MASFTNKKKAGVVGWGDRIATWGSAIFHWGDPTATMANLSKNSTSFVNKVKIIASKLLKEDGYYLLLETGDKILISRGTDFTNRAKN